MIRGGGNFLHTRERHPRVTKGAVRPGAPADTPLRLGRFLGTSGEFWLNLQKLYELRLAERKHGAEIARLSSLDNDNRLHASS